MKINTTNGSMYDSCLACAPTAEFGLNSALIFVKLFIKKKFGYPHVRTTENNRLNKMKHNNIPLIQNIEHLPRNQTSFNLTQIQPSTLPYAYMWKPPHQNPWQSITYPIRIY